MNHLIATPWKSVFANDLDAFVPEVWAQESLMILENNMVAGNLVHRDFVNEIRAFGDVVNTRKPGSFTAKRKGVSDDVTIQDASATNVAVPLNQQLHTSFLIRDGESSKGFKNLVAEYLYPGVLSIAQAIDEIVMAQTYRFRANNVGQLGVDPTKSTVVAARTLANTNKIPTAGRNMIVTPNAEGALLNISEFINAEKIGDDGTALREGSIGRKFGFDFYMDQNTPQIDGTSVDSVTTALTADEPAGETVLAVTAFASGDYAVGQFLVVTGDGTVQKITAADDVAETITVTPGLKTGVSTGAVVTVYGAGAINEAAGYSAAYLDDMTVDGFTLAPQSGQLFSIGANEYGAIGTPTTTALAADIPLTASVADDAAVNLGPAGSYCFGFHRNALALVVRPLATPEPGTGALSYVAEYNGLAIRVTITYNGVKQGHLVTVDLLCGVAALDTGLGFVMYA